LDSLGEGSLGEFHVTVDRPSGLDRLVLRVETGQAASDALAREIATRVRRRASVTVEVDLVPPGTLPPGPAWFSDRRA
jgi:phenylacetate-coenzyme A ligase PaaK-like adenylate-forming protein